MAANINTDTTAAPPRAPFSWRTALWIALAALPLLLLWEALGADYAIAKAIVGTASRFPLREDAWLVRVLHDGGRIAAGLVLVAQIVHACLTVQPGTPTRAQRWFWVAMTLVGWIGVAWLKSRSLTSCPWELAEFGGRALYVPHWQLGVRDGGPGRCFPSGHAMAGFAFFSLAFLWAPTQPRRAVQFACAAALAGTVFGIAQIFRGAHFVSHVAWSAWLCWTVFALVAAARDLFVTSKLNRQKTEPAA